MQQQKTLNLVQLSILSALIIIMTFSPIGFIQVGVISITLIHIPVIIGGVMLGTKSGAILGVIFGLSSVARAVTSALAGDILFNPFISGNPFGSLCMAIVPRILLGVLAGLLFKGFSKVIKKPTIPLVLASVISTLVHTFSVLCLMMIFFDTFALVDIFMFIISINGLLEMVVAGIACTSVATALTRIRKPITN